MSYKNWNSRMFLDDMWHDIAGKKFTVKEDKKMPSLDELRESEWCTEYEQGCRDRMIMGAFRYGLLKKQNFIKYDIVKELKKRFKKYEESGNLEFLLDCGNMCMLQYMKGKLNNQKVDSIDDGEHAQEI